MKILGFGLSEKKTTTAVEEETTIPVMDRQTYHRVVTQAFNKQQALWRILNDLLTQDTGVTEEMINVAEKNAEEATRALQYLVHLPTEDHPDTDTD